MPLRDRPAALDPGRQKVPTLDRSRYASAEGVVRGAYVLAGTDDENRGVLLLATGSEVHLAVAAYEQLTAEGISARVVSMPSWELFEDQPQEYRDTVIPPDVTARVSVEEATCLGCPSTSARRGGRRAELVRTLRPARQDRGRSSPGRRR